MRGSKPKSRAFCKCRRASAWVSGRRVFRRASVPGSNGGGGRSGNGDGGLNTPIGSPLGGRFRRLLPSRTGGRIPRSAPPPSSHSDSPSPSVPALLPAATYSS